jgi:hypothetical protein
MLNAVPGIKLSAGLWQLQCYFIPPPSQFSSFGNKRNCEAPCDSQPLSSVARYVELSLFSGHLRTLLAFPFSPGVDQLPAGAYRLPFLISFSFPSRRQRSWRRRSQACRRRSLSCRRRRRSWNSCWWPMVQCARSALRSADRPRPLGCSPCAVGAVQLVLWW